MKYHKLNKPLKDGKQFVKVTLLCILLLMTVTISCKKDKNKDLLYEVNKENVSASIANKGKEKTREQFISILYVSLFQKAISVNKLLEITDLIISIGDKNVVHEVIISNFMNTGQVILPTEQEMRDDLDTFIEETYKRFFVRGPSIAEKTWLKNYINTHPTVNPEIVYTTFALSNEYRFY